MASLPKLDTFLAGQMESLENLPSCDTEDDDQEEHDSDVEKGEFDDDDYLSDIDSDIEEEADSDLELENAIRSHKKVCCSMLSKLVFSQQN